MEFVLVSVNNLCSNKQKIIVSKVNFAECGTFVKLLEIVGKKENLVL